MAYTLQELVDDPSLWETLKGVPPNCCECSKPIQGSSFPAPNNGKACEDCYYFLLGNEIEKHPLGRTP